MSFARPEWLWLIVPALIGLALDAWGETTAVERRSRFAVRGLLRGRRPARVASWSSWLLLAVAAAGPEIGQGLREVPVVGIDMVIAIDASRSMLVRDVSPSRLARARRETVELARRCAGARVGLIVVGGDGEVRCPLTRDLGSLETLVEEIDPALVSTGGTDLGQSLLAAIPLFDATSRSRRVVVLLTDGENLGDPASLVAASDAAREASVEVHAIVVGTERGGPVPVADGAAAYVTLSGDVVTSRADVDVPRALAQATGGVCLDLESTPFPAVRLVQDELSDDLGGPSGSALRLVPIDRYRWLVAGAVWLLLYRRLLPTPTPSLRLSSVPVLLCAPLLVAWVVADPPTTEGLHRFDEGDYRGAAAAFRAVLEQPDAPDATRYNLALSLMRAGDFEGAVVEAERAASVDALRGPATFAVGLARARLAEQAASRGDAAVAERLLQDARRSMIAAIDAGYGPAAAHDLEVVTRRLDALRRESSGGDGSKDPDSDDLADDESPSSPGGGAADGGSGRDQPAGPDQLPPSDPDEVDSNEAPGEPVRLDGGMYRDQARNLFEIVKQMERERMENERRKVAGARGNVARDW